MNENKHKLCVSLRAFVCLCVHVTVHVRVCTLRADLREKVNTRCNSRIFPCISVVVVLGKLADVPAAQSRLQHPRSSVRNSGISSRARTIGRHVECGPSLTRVHASGLATGGVSTQQRECLKE